MQFLNRSLLPILLLCAFNQFSLMTVDPDLWGHIKFGEDAWGQGSLPETDPYSYTAQGAVWVNHEWLTEILFYKIFDLFDSTGILAFKMMIGLFILLLTAREYLRDDPDRPLSKFGPFIALSLLIPILAPGFMPRPHLFTYLFWTLLLFILKFYFSEKENKNETGRGGKAVFLIPLIFLFWINTHGGAIAGLAILGVASSYDLIKSRILFTPLAASGLLSVFATLLNPYGWELWTFFMHSLSQPRNISEWNGIPIWHLHQLPFKIYSLLFVAAWMASKNKWRWDAFIIFPSIYFAFRHQRHIPLAAIAMTPFLCEQAIHWMKQWNERLKIRKLYDDAKIPLMAGLLAFGLAQGSLGFLKNSANQFKLFVDAGVYPIYAARFMKENDLNGNVWNPFDWGEYLIWKLPESKISVDGRFRTVYPDEILSDSIQFMIGGKGWENLPGKYPTDYILVRKSDGTDLRMKRMKDWTPIYEDLISVLYVNSNPENPKWKELKSRKLMQNRNTPSFYFP